MGKAIMMQALGGAVPLTITPSEATKSLAFDIPAGTSLVYVTASDISVRAFNKIIAVTIDLGNNVLHCIYEQRQYGTQMVDSTARIGTGAITTITTKNALFDAIPYKIEFFKR